MKGFVFGKFYPFHIGHQKMIEFALTKGDVTVLVCADSREKIDGNIRKNWIEETFPNNENLKVKVFEYNNNDFPNSSVSDWEVSKIWSQVFKGYFPNENFVVTSEEYGNMLSEIMNIEHFMFDEKRENIQISASRIRENIYHNWSFLPLSVQKYFALKVVLLGTESTGKTFITNRLTDYFKANKVSEAGRDLIPYSNEFEFEDLEKVYTEHAKRIENVDYRNSFLTIIDTDVHITKSYAEFIFEKKLIVPKNILDINKADLYLYSTKDAEYIQDGTRLALDERNKLDDNHRKILKQHGIDFLEISESWENRQKMAIRMIEELIAGKSQTLI